MNQERLLSWIKLGRELIGDDINQLFLFLNKNKSMLAPYHNNQHMMAVALTADRIYKLDYGTSNYDRMCLFLSASLHDYNHSMGEFSDSENIKNTKEAIFEFFDDDFLYRVVSNTIECTEFPFIIEPNNDIEKCLRDADLLMFLEEDWDDFFEGLKKETKMDMSKQENFEWVKQQKFYTSTGLNLLNEFTLVS